jgi:subtilisin family serine protease
MTFGALEVAKIRQAFVRWRATMAASYYYRAGQRVPVVLSESACAVRVSGEREAVAVPGWFQRTLNSRHLLLIRDDLALGERDRVDNPTLLRMLGENEQRMERTRRERGLSPATSPIVEVVRGRADIVTFPVAVKDSSSAVLIPTGEVVAQFQADVTAERVEEIAKARGWTVARRLHFVPNGHVLRASKSDDPFAFANELVERHGAQYAHPVFLEDISDRERIAQADRVAPPVRPRLYAQQWHLANTGQAGGVAGQDIDAENAWRITIGSPAITVCIIDSGVSAAHECLQGADKIVAGYDFAGLDADPSPTTSSHGTACAALATAAAGQILGVAHGCRLMPIRRTGLDDHLRLAEAFAFAADHGADVISCSFGVDGEPWVLPDVVRSAFEYATTRGRRGKGVPIFFAAGNGNEPVTSDEWASSKLTIAVAASTDQARRAPYSDFGPEIEVCAPSSGGLRGITTAANEGYTSVFGGTSAAAPIAAGVAALVLSIAPNLRWQELRNVLQSGARKIDRAGGEYDHAGRSDLYGYGQVDAFQALQQIPVLLEIERATDTTALDRQIRDFFGWVQGLAAGATIASFVSARRLGILALLQRSPPFRDAADRLLRIMADLAAQLALGADIEIPEQAWPAIELVARSVKDVPPDLPTTERSEPSAPRNRETPMPTNAARIEDALNRIAAALGGPSGGAGAGTAASPKAPRPPVDVIQPFPQKPPGREEIDKQIYYSSLLPPLRYEEMLQMEAELPAFVAHLRSLHGRPAARAEITAIADVAKRNIENSERSAVDQQRLAALAQTMARDAFGNSDLQERHPGVLVVLAAAALGYQIGRDLANRHK